MMTSSFPFYDLYIFQNDPIAHPNKKRVQGNLKVKGVTSSFFNPVNSGPGGRRPPNAGARRENAKKTSPLDENPPLVSKHTHISTY